VAENSRPRIGEIRLLVRTEVIAVTITYHAPPKRRDQSNISSSSAKLLMGIPPA
jgi:hypothetical protein